MTVDDTLRKQLIEAGWTPPPTPSWNAARKAGDKAFLKAWNDGASHDDAWKAGWLAAHPLVPAGGEA